MVDYYRILEIDYAADQKTISRAFRKKIKALHPDTGEYDQQMFALVMEAYGTLRDRELRHHYHDDLLQYLSEKNREQYALVPGERVIFSNRLDSILKKIRIFDKKHYRKIRRNFQEDLCIFVSRKEAETGIRFSVTLPVRRVCPQCFGNHGEECPLCDGLGMVSSSHPHILTLSPPLNHGEIQLVPVQGKPCKGAYFITRKLKVRIHIISNL